MKTFEHRTGYNEPVLNIINKDVTIGIYYPLKKKEKTIVSIYNSVSEESISLFSNTLIDVSNSLIESILQSSTFFFNKKKINNKRKRNTKK
jgi:hypothetical protein